MLLTAAYDGISMPIRCSPAGMTPAIESFHKAKAAARQALRLQPELGEGYASLAHVRLHDWDWVGLESDFRQAAELDPRELAQRIGWGSEAADRHDSRSTRGCSG